MLEPLLPVRWSARLSIAHDAALKTETADFADQDDQTETSSSRLEDVSDTETDGRAGTLQSRLTVAIPEFQMRSPRSCHVPFTPSAVEKREGEALAIFRQALKETKLLADVDFAELSLDDFSIYLDTPDYPCEMRCLHYLDTKSRHSNFYVDGVLSAAGAAVFIKHVPIAIVPIGGYGCSESHSVRDQIWVQSELCKGSDVYYRLGTPAKEYRRFFEPFAWVADLTKHVVDFMLVMAEKDVKVSIHHFRKKFRAWLSTVHCDSKEFAQWLAKHPSDDFRSSVAANIAFVYKEAFSVLGYGEAHFHTIWRETLNFTMYPEKPLKRRARSDITQDRTAVTDYIYQLFSHLPFGDWLQASPLSPESRMLRNQIISDNHLEHGSRFGKRSAAKSRPLASTSVIERIGPGDTISTARDTESSGSMWKREQSNGFTDVDRWFGLVQKVLGKDEQREFEILWYYRPVDTCCGVMKYPWDNELFLSDHCSCLEKHKIQAHEVLGVHQVEFGGNSTTTCEFFCRQVYISQDRKWLSLKERDLRCPHTSATGAATDEEFFQGGTYIVQFGTARSEPCELVDPSFDGPDRCRFRKLLRRRQVDPAASDARVNELVYSHESVVYSRSRILGKCHVRVFEPGETIPTPYNRDGVGCFFFMTHEQVVGQDDSIMYRPIQTPPATLRQGFDPAVRIPQLNGLDLFCGGGNFGRGLEDGGAVQMKWANDIDSKAIHTYMANAKRPEIVDPFLGSVDDLLQEAINGHFSSSVPPIGKVDFISGGSPCPGFSVLTNDKTTDKQRRNQSLVAAFASFIDLYRPKFGLLENVPGIVRTKVNRDQDVFSQLLCAVVGMGYQAQMVLLDASSCGSAQRRTRVFLVIAAPGCHLPARPQQSHADPPETRQRGFGTLSTGEAFVERPLPVATPFPFVTALQATRDLPKISDAQTDTCIEFPDHRVSFGLTRLQRSRISLIPKQPWGMNFLKTSATMLTPSERSCFRGGRANEAAAAVSEIRQKSSAYGRMFPHRLMETIVTASNPGDGKNGRQLHWDEDRPISIMEARRAQGFPDEEVLLGPPQTQYKIVGNSVAREVALALGITVRDAWVDSHWGTETHMVGGTKAEEEHAHVAKGIANMNGVNGQCLMAETETLTLPTRSGEDSTSTLCCNGMQHAAAARPDASARSIVIPLKRRLTNPRLGSLMDASCKRGRN